MAWFIHDQGDEKLPYSEMCFYPKNAAFNLTWREEERRREIRSYPGPPRGKLLTGPNCDNYDGDHSEHYSGRLGIYAGHLKAAGPYHKELSHEEFEHQTSWSHYRVLRRCQSNWIGPEEPTIQASQAAS